MPDATIQDAVRRWRQKSPDPGDQAAAFAEALAGRIRAALESARTVEWPGVGTFQLLRPSGEPFEDGGRADVAGLVPDVDAATARAWAAELAEHVAHVLRERRAMRLEGFGELRVVLRPPQLETTPRGHRLIRPAETAVEFHGAAPVERPEGPCIFAFHPDPALRRALESLHSSTVLLVQAERDPFEAAIRMRLEAAGWEARTVTTAAEALDILRAGGGFLVVLDASVPGAQALAREIKFDPRTGMTPLILTFPDIRMFLRPPEAVVVGDQNLAEPYEFRTLMEMIETEVERAAEEWLIFRQQVSIHLPTEEPAIEQVAEDIERLLTHSGLTEEGQQALVAAAREAMRNAADHGNRNRRDLKIEITYLVDMHKVTISVRDYGEGFDHRKYVEKGQRGPIYLARERRAQGRLGGLGILLMLKCTDMLEYNEVGNRVTLVRRL
jgi:anti-sigma regulatory factor (Ser/Thr protein kinase)/nucleoid DNA-binding protein/CheY-like chemotaxis protein